MKNEITFDGETMRGAGTVTVALATMTPAVKVAGALVVTKLAKIVVAKTVGVTPT